MSPLQMVQEGFTLVPDKTELWEAVVHPLDRFHQKESVILGTAGSGGENVQGSKQRLECGDASEMNWFNPKRCAWFLDS